MGDDRRGVVDGNCLGEATVGPLAAKGNGQRDRADRAAAGKATIAATAADRLRENAKGLEAVGLDRAARGVDVHDVANASDAGSATHGETETERAAATHRDGAAAIAAAAAAAPPATGAPPLPAPPPGPRGEDPDVFAPFVDGAAAEMAAAVAPPPPPAPAPADGEAPAAGAAVATAATDRLRLDGG